MGIREPGKLYEAVEALLEDQKGPYDAELEIQLAGSDHVTTLIDAIRPVVIQDLLVAFAAEHRTNADDEWPDIDQDEVEAFLAKLDALRKPADPPPSMLNQAITGGRMLLRDEMLQRVKQLSNLPWSGDLTYGQALDDVRSALKAAADGKPTPTPAWLRCPSKYKTGRGAQPTVQCTLALPHGEQHEYAPQGSTGRVVWTDEQSTTPPPKPAPMPCGSCIPGKICDLPAMHDGPHQGQGAEWPDTRQYCGAPHQYSDEARSVTLYCRKTRLHDGEHQAPTGERWS